MEQVFVKKESTFASTVLNQLNALHELSYSLRPLIPVLIWMYLDTKICPDTFVLRQVIVVGVIRSM
jgi:hypothetical protein